MQNEQDRNYQKVRPGAFKSRFLEGAKVSLLGVDSLWGDCTFIPADWGS